MPRTKQTRPKRRKKRAVGKRNPNLSSVSTGHPGAGFFDDRAAGAHMRVGLK